MKERIHMLRSFAWLAQLDIATESFSLSPPAERGERTLRHFDVLCAPEPQDGPLTPALSPSEGERGNYGPSSSTPRFIGRGTNAMADKVSSGFPAWRPPLPTPLLQRRRGRSSRRLVAVSRCARPASALIVDHALPSPYPGPMRTKQGSYPAHAPAQAARLKDDAPQSTGRPSSLVDTCVIYCGDNLEQLKKLP